MTINVPKDDKAFDVYKKIEEKQKKRDERHYRKRALKSKSGYDKWIRAGSLVLFFLIWQLICTINAGKEFFNPRFLPSPIDVIKTGYKYVMDGSLWEHIFSSLYRTVLGFGLGTAIALLLGIIITQSKLLDNLISPILNMIGPIPVFAFLPMFIIWFGIGETSKVVLIAYATFMPLLTYTIDGIRNTDPVLIRSAKSLGASNFQVFTKVIMKSALPNVFVGMKVSLALTFSALVVAEMMGASKGLGFMINNARNWFKIDDMFLAAALIGVEYTIFYSILSGIESMLFKWKRNGLASAVEK